MVLGRRGEAGGVGVGCGVGVSVVAVGVSVGSVGLSVGAVGVSVGAVDVSVGSVGVFVGAVGVSVGAVGVSVVAVGCPEGVIVVLSVGSGVVVMDARMYAKTVARFLAPQFRFCLAASKSVLDRSAGMVASPLKKDSSWNREVDG